MTFTINIRPRYPFGVDKQRQFSEARVLADDILKLPGFEEAKCLESIAKVSGAFPEPLVVTAVISGDKQIANAAVKELLKLLRAKREEGNYDAYAIEVHNLHFHLAEDTHELVEANIRNLIESAPDYDEPESRFARILQAVQDALDLDFEKLTVEITHRGARGSARERMLIQDVLRKYLSARFGLTRGEIIASNEEVSGECDAIIYDALECPALHTEPDYQIVPVEAVYAVIEIKSDLDSIELKKTFDKFQKIKKLPKTAFLPVQPDRKWTFNCYGKTLAYFPVAGFLFAYRSSTTLDTLAVRLQELQAKTSPEYCTDLICVLDSGCIVNSNSTLTAFTPRPDTTVCVMESDRAIHFFMALLQNLLSTARTDPISINSYLKGPPLGKLRRPKI